MVVFGERYSKAVVPNLFGTRDGFGGRQFFHGWGWGCGMGWGSEQEYGLGMIQAHYIQAYLLLCGRFLTDLPAGGGWGTQL